MWEWLATLPIWGQIAIPLALIIGIVLMMLYGRGAIDWGIAKFKFGGTKRTCVDCLTLILGKRESLEMELDAFKEEQEKNENLILKQQMNFTEQKIIEAQGLILNAYSDKISELRKENNPEEEIKQFRCYYGLISDTFRLLKDEIRRSFKENGFYEKGGIEFSNFVKDKMSSYVSFATQHMNNLYPMSDMIVSSAERMKMINTMVPKLEDMLFEIYIRAKEIVKETEDKNKAISDKKEARVSLFHKEVNDFIEE